MRSLARNGGASNVGSRHQSLREGPRRGAEKGDTRASLREGALKEGDRGQNVPGSGATPIGCKSVGLVQGVRGKGGLMAKMEGGAPNR
eukprot:410901-Heterocapsa_arctica.AAC.1